MAPPRELPGYYYDHEKQKYFRVQANHKVGKEAPHSLQSVEAQKRAADRVKGIDFQQRHERAGRIARSRPSTVLEARLGVSPSRNLSSIAKEYATELSPQFAAKNNLKLCSFAISPQGELYVAGAAPLTFDIIHANKPRAPRSVITDVIGYHGLPKNMVIVGEFTLATASASTIRLYRPSDTVSIITIPQPRTYISYLTPSPNQAQFAYCHEQGLSIYDCNNFSLICNQPCTSIKTEQMRCSFKDQDPNIVMSGQRNGAVNLTDLRAPETVHRLQHSSAVNGITTRSRSANHIIVSGLLTTCLYDLRYSRAPTRPTSTNRQRSKSRNRHSIPIPASEPLVTFHVPPDRRSELYPDTGNSLTYLSDLDIVALSTSLSSPSQHTPNRVTLYHASTGRIASSPLTDYSFSHPILGVEARRMRDGQESIMMLTGKQLIEWTVDTAREPDETSLQYELERAQFPPNSQTGIETKYSAGWIADNI